MIKVKNREDTPAEISWHLMKLFASRRNEMKLSVRELGKKANVSYTVIYDLEQRCILPKMETMLKLAYALEFKVDVKQCVSEKQPALGIIFCLSDEARNPNLYIKKSHSSISETLDEQIRKLLNQKKLSKKDIDEIENFIAFKKSQHK